ncbi:MAG: cupin domain-containing protein [Bacteroidota bacterium]|nr:cupin domain-containing protein [Bacteroidota bacterium]
MDKRVFENPVIGDRVTFLKTSEETNGAYTLLEIDLIAKGGNALHYHRSFSETFTTVEGELSLQAGNEHKVLKPGASYTIAPMQVHRFYNAGDKPIRFQVEFRLGHAGFENSMKIAYGLARDGLTDKKSVPKKFSHMALLITMSDTNIPGFLSLLMPLFKWKAKQADMKKVYSELIAKYC